MFQFHHMTVSVLFSCSKGVGSQIFWNCSGQNLSMSRIDSSLQYYYFWQPSKPQRRERISLSAFSIFSNYMAALVWLSPLFVPVWKTPGTLLLSLALKNELLNPMAVSSLRLRPLKRIRLSSVLWSFWAKSVDVGFRLLASISFFLTASKNVAAWLYVSLFFLCLLKRQS